MSSISVIPKPNRIDESAGIFKLTEKSTFSYESECETAVNLIKKFTRLKKGENPVIRLSLNRSISSDEGYQLEIGASGIDIRAKTSAGFLYGAETLRQLLPPETETTGITGDVFLPYIKIEDAPRYSYRGFMLDVSRHFFGVDIIKRILDQMALLKLNRFHWHLSDAQGWRIEIKKYPKLTEIGSKRDSTLVYGWVLGKKYVNQKEYGGFYTQDQIREIVAYAKQRNIEVIPEIDIPGHATALLASYPELSCTGERLKPSNGVKIPPDLVCAGKDSSYKMLFEIFDEIIDLFPFKYIHIGGDEANKIRWENCPRCQAKIKERGLRDEKELQSYFMNRIASYLTSKGCRVICWNDGFYQTLQPDIICQHWFLNKKETVRQINEGRKAIYSYASGYYLDYSFKTFGLKNSYNIGTGEYHYNLDGQKNVIGVEAPLWCEAVYNLERIEWQMYPRILAACENAWCNHDKKNYNEFLDRLVAFEERLDIMNIQHALKQCYLKRQKTGFTGFLNILKPGEHPAMREYRLYNEVTGYNKSDGKSI